MNLKTTLLAACLLLFAATPASLLAQNAAGPTPVVVGEQVTVYSDVLGEDRPVMIHKPDGYDQSTAAYPVLYLLDGDTHFVHTVGIMQFLSGVGHMSPMLVVAIPNTSRTRDLTPPLSTEDPRFPTAGGADLFLQFLADELKPYVDAHYRTAPYEALVGHSFGGLFAIHALMTRPEAFDGYVAISPSLWWDSKALLPRAEVFFDEHEDLKGYLYMTIGNEGGAMLAAAWSFAGILEEKAPEGFDWHFDYMAEETHGSIPHRSTYNALEALYADWTISDPAALFEEGGLEALDAHYTALSEKFGYPILTPENTINQMGYWLIGQQRAEEAIAVLAQNVERFPASVNVYDSLGDAYDASEQPEKAKKHYEKACTMARASNHPNTSIYCRNLARITEQLTSQ